MLENVVLTEAVYYILLSLNEPKHGYGIIKNVQELSNDRVNLAPGTLYGAINTLIDKRWICLYPNNDGSKKKEYQLTDLGRRTLNNEIERLRELLNNGDRIIWNE